MPNYSEISAQLQRNYSSQRKPLPPLTKDELEESIALIDANNPGNLPTDFVADVEALLNPPEPPAPIPPQNLGAFRMGMMGDDGYNRIFALSPIVGLRVENSISMAESDIYWDAVRLLWNALIDSLAAPDKPSNEEVAAWNTIAAAAHIRDNEGDAVAFSEEGRL